MPDDLTESEGHHKMNANHRPTQPQYANVYRIAFTNSKRFKFALLFQSITVYRSRL